MFLHMVSFPSFAKLNNIPLCVFLFHFLLISFGHYDLTYLFFYKKNASMSVRVMLDIDFISSEYKPTCSNISFAL